MIPVYRKLQLIWKVFYKSIKLKFIEQQNVRISKKIIVNKNNRQRRGLENINT